MSNRASAGAALRRLALLGFITLPSLCLPAGPARALAVEEDGGPTAGELEQPGERDDPTLWLRSGPKRQVEAFALQGMVPGVSRVDEIRKTFGEPREQTTKGNGELWRYAIGPFSEVELWIQDRTVQRCGGRFAQPRGLDEVLAELNLTQFFPVTDYAADGTASEVVVPERGLHLLLQPGAAPPLVRGLRLQPPSPDDFVLRAQSDNRLQLRQRLSDLEQALQLSPDHAGALVLLAETWDSLGYPEAALARLEPAGARQPHDRELRLAIAVLQARLGHREESRRQLETLRQDRELDPVLRCRVELELAHALAGDRQLPTQQVVDQYLRAIGRAQERLERDSHRGKRAAHRILLAAHVGAARTIARGEYSDKTGAIRKWFTNANVMLEELERSGNARAEDRISLLTVAVECQAALGTQADPAPVLAEWARTVELQLAAHADDAAQRYLHTMHGQMLLDAARVRQEQGALADAARFAEEAAEELAQTAQASPSHAWSELLLGEAYFLLGSLPAVTRQDHAAAIAWYDRALPLLSYPLPEWLRAREVDVAEALISMGISYWETESRQRAILVTETALNRLQKSDASTAADSARVVGYQNLAFMYESVGQKDKAQAALEVANRLKQEAGPVR